MTFAKGNIKASKLSNEAVYQMRLDYERGETQGALARKYHVSVNTVGRILRGESRQRVPMPSDPDEAAKRLVALQEERHAEVAAKLHGDIQRELDKPATKAERDLADWEKASKYGVTKE